MDEQTNKRRPADIKQTSRARPPVHVRAGQFEQISILVRTRLSCGSK